MTTMIKVEKNEEKCESDHQVRLSLHGMVQIGAKIGCAIIPTVELNRTTTTRGDFFPDTENTKGTIPYPSTILLSCSFTSHGEQLLSPPMGDCNIRLILSEVLQRKLLSGASATSLSSSWRTIRLASDATLADALDIRCSTSSEDHHQEDTSATCSNDGSTSIRTLLENQTAVLWDCTAYPPKDISKICLEQFPDKSGSRSLTLFDAGWYPSGTLILNTAAEGPPRRTPASYDDFQYNLPKTDATITAATTTGQSSAINNNVPPPVQLTQSTGPMLPSQVLQSVTTRFHDDTDVQQDDDAVVARQLRHAHAVQARERERQRQAKLQARIRQLDTKQSSNNGVATQVQKMLIKSRATGRPKLDEQDRVYLRLVVDDGGHDHDEQVQEDYCYFSRQDVVGKILSEKYTYRQTSSNSSNCAQLQAELLVRKPGSDEYRRLPNLMRFYEAVEAKLIASFDRVVIRFYDPTQEEATISITEEEDKEDSPSESMTNTVPLVPPSVATASYDVSKDESTVIESDAKSIEKSDEIVDEALALALANAPDKKPKKLKTGKTPSSSSTSTKANNAVSKVRQMQIKSKAQGDGKRVKLPDRFFLQAVVARREASGTVTVVAVSSPYFLARSDPLQRLVKDGWVKAPLESAQFFVRASDTTPDGHFRRIADPTLSVEELSRTGFLNAFDEVVVYY